MEGSSASCRLQNLLPPFRCGVRTPLARTRQRGQVMPMAVVFVLAAILGLWVVNDAGEITIEKMSLQNTADATAYSTAVLMARNWNYAAYLNRAMVANQVAVGQGVGFNAWNKGCIRYSIGCTVAAVLDFGYIDYYLTQNDQTLTELSDAQNQFNLGATAAEAQLSSDVTLANDPNVQQITYFNDIENPGYDPCTYTAPTGQASVPCQQWSVPTVSQLLASNGTRFTQFQNVVIASQDHFTANRSFNWPETNLLIYTVQPKEYGGDELIQGTQNGYYKWEWTAMDTLSDYDKLFGISLGETVKAYGAARAPVAGSPTAFNYNAYAGNKIMWGMGAWDNPKAAAQAASADASNNVHTMSGYGLRPFLDVSNDDQSDEGDTVLIIVTKPDSSLALQKNWAKVTNSSYQVPKQIDLEADGSLPNKQLTTLAKAQIYFYRPYETQSHVIDWNRQNMPSWITGDSEYAAAYQNQADQYEHGSLYSPFWDAHLVDTTDDERRLAQQYAGIF